MKIFDLDSRNAREKADTYIIIRYHHQFQEFKTDIELGNKKIKQFIQRRV